MTPDDLLALIKRRRSFKPAALRPDPIPRATIDRILEAATWAPSHGRTEPWRFVVYAGDARAALGEAFAAGYRAKTTADGSFDPKAFEGQRTRVHSAPVWIALGILPGLKPDGSPVVPLEEEKLALACAVQNLHLMTTAEGLGGQWTTGQWSMTPEVAAFTGFTNPAHLMGFFFLGLPAADWPTATRTPLNSRARWAE